MPERRERFTRNEFPTLAPYEGVEDVFGNIPFGWNGILDVRSGKNYCRRQNAKNHVGAAPT